MSTQAELATQSIGLSSVFNTFKHVINTSLTTTHKAVTAVDHVVSTVEQTARATKDVNEVWATKIVTQAEADLAELQAELADDSDKSKDS